MVPERMLNISRNNSTYRQPIHSYYLSCGTQTFGPATYCGTLYVLSWGRSHTMRVEPIKKCVTVVIVGVLQHTQTFGLALADNMKSMQEIQIAFTKPT